MNIWRVAGVALVAALALFLVVTLLKLLLVASVAFLGVRVVGGRLAGRAFGQMGRGGWRSTDIISIDNPAYRSPVRGSVDRIIPIS